MTHTSHALLVLGMHRSGTSALTGALALRGVQLGTDLMPPAEGNNPKGFWEHMGVVNIHDQLLETLGQPWHRPGPMPEGWRDHPATAVAREQLRALIQEQFLAHPVWAIKDPRLCRLLPLWRPLLEELGVAASVVVIARDPREVADSLQKRDQFTLEQSRELWMWYLADAIHDSHGLPRCALTYPRLLADPVAEIEALVESSHLPLPIMDADSVQRLTAFIETQDRHHRAHPVTTPEWELAGSIYRRLLHQPVPWEDVYTLIRANTMTGPALAKVLDDYTQLRLRERRKLDQTQQALTLAHEAHTQTLYQLNQTRHALTSTQKVLDQARYETGLDIARTRRECDQAQRERDQAQRERDQAQQARDEAQRERDDHLRQRLELRATLQDILASRSWRWSKPLRGLERLLRGQHPLASRNPAPSLQSPSPEEAANAHDESPAAIDGVSQNSPLPLVGEGTQRAEDEPTPGYLRDLSKLIAFYLPQYHWVAENAQWWGPGFTEWSHVVRARPNFEGHPQPHTPSELGLYDLGNIDTMRAQASLAQEYGVHGFCFYYYWFSGRRILEQPLDNFLQSDIDMPFCLCWANENWTRTWDGGEQHILLKQHYADGDEERFIADIHRFLADPRYIRVDGKPMLLVYRIKAFPDPAASIEKWQAAATRFGLPRLHIVAVDFMDMEDHDDPRHLGADALVEFPPHKFGNINTISSTWPPMINSGFHGVFYEYPAMALHGIERKTPEFPLYRGLIPSWDNTARRQDKSLTVLNATPDCFALWLQFLRAWTREAHPHDDNGFIFVNAWNEWGEGCHLEPDTHWGLSYLDEILRSSYIPPQLQQPLDEVRHVIAQKIKDGSAHE